MGTEDHKFKCPICRTRRIFMFGTLAASVFPARAFGMFPYPQPFGFARSRGCSCIGDGTKGIFQLGVCSYDTLKTRNKYVYATCVSTASGVAASCQYAIYGAAAGNGTRGIFQIGNSYAIRNKYIYATCANATAAAASCSNQFGNAVGNSTRGIFSLGESPPYGCPCCLRPSSIRNKYTYAADTNASATAATSTYSANGAAGNCSRGIFALGNKFNKYVYSTDTNILGTASGCATCFGSATGNATRGIFALGYNGYCGGHYETTRKKYTYACDAYTGSGVGAASTGSAYGSAAGNSTRGIFALGYATCSGVTTRNKYTYATCSSTASGVGAASSASYGGSATSWSTGVNS